MEQKTEIEWIMGSLENSSKDVQRGVVLKFPEESLRLLGGRHSKINERLEDLGLMFESIFLDVKNIKFSTAAMARTGVKMSDHLLLSIMRSETPALETLRSECAKHRAWELQCMASQIDTLSLAQKMDEMHSNTPQSYRPGC
jgi:hypothetical protein